jgi:4-carboxymuconolactone decarboxylase
MDRALRDKGLANRKAVLGEDYVNKSMAAADSFNGPFQEVLNEYCWGLIWSDERLPKKTRSMLNLVMLACLNRMHEWELHLKGALRNGVTKDEVQAIIHQIAVYTAYRSAWSASALPAGCLPRSTRATDHRRGGCPFSPSPWCASSPERCAVPQAATTNAMAMPTDATTSCDLVAVRKLALRARR